MMHTLFTLEHNAICDRLHAEYPRWNDEQLFERARLVNAALLAKIHTVEWTPAVISHPTTVTALRANWFGLAEERVRKLFGRISSSEVVSGIPGSETAHFGVPYSLTEEFVAVYRMTLHNFPRFMQEFERPDGRFMDLAAVDVLRVRELGVPRYCELRRLLHMTVPKTFEQLTDNPRWAAELRAVYGDVERVDLIVGMYAEPLPKGFAFSDTAFRIFILMASRRLNSDRFFTKDYGPQVYTQAGIDWIDASAMTDVLLRHMPELRPALRGIDNAFKPWKRAAARST
jgi:hypothetical protein